MTCQDCRFLITIKQPTYPKSYNNYYCAAAIENTKEGIQYAMEYKKQHYGLDVNFISQVNLPNNPPDWCPIIQGFEIEYPT